MLSVIAVSCGLYAMLVRGSRAEQGTRAGHFGDGVGRDYSWK